MAGTRSRTAAKLALGAVLVVVGLFGGASDASAQFLPQATPGDYCADRSPGGLIPARSRAYIYLHVSPSGSGSVTARLWHQYGLTECVRTPSPTCPPNCTIEVQTVCEYHCQHNHIPPYPWTVQLIGTPSSGNYLHAWSGKCEPIAAAPRSSCIVRMNIDQAVTALFGNQPDTAPPSVPVLSATAGRYDVTLTWTRSTDNFWLGGYDIFKDGTRIARVTGGTTSFRVTNLLCRTTYQFSVEAFDTVKGAASNTVTVTTGACSVAVAPRPNTVIHVARVRRHTAYFHWGYTGSVRPTKYQCKLDRHRWRRCRPGKTYRDLRRGRHRFAVRAGNANGWDRTPATRRFRIR
ncbi:MAG: fibronectin type III domain-containing protein [Thermoleophilia bacterium]|nr:fibronectin type III domain-containing protein [Thermoleophilia bacterium]